MTDEGARGQAETGRKKCPGYPSLVFGIISLSLPVLVAVLSTTLPGEGIGLENIFLMFILSGAAAILALVFGVNSLKFFDPAKHKGYKIGVAGLVLSGTGIISWLILVIVVFFQG